MNFVNSKSNRELVRYITIFSNELVEYGDLEDQEIILEKISFCLKELEFWEERKNPFRYQETLRCLLKWLFDKVESNF